MIEGKIYRDPVSGEWAVKLNYLTYTLNAKYSLRAVKNWRDEKREELRKREQEEADWINKQARMELME